MYRKWTKNDIEASKARFRRLYAQSPIEYRFLCGHDIQSEDDEDALDYYMIGVWLVQHRKYSDWSKEKSFDLAEILEFMRVYRIRIPRYIKRTRFYRKKINLKDDTTRIIYMGTPAVRHRAGIPLA